ARRRLLGRAPWLVDEPKVERDEEEDELGNGAQSADTRRLHEPRAENRHGNVGEIEVELNPCADEECAGQELAKISALRCEVDGGCTKDERQQNKDCHHVSTI